MGGRGRLGSRRCEESGWVGGVTGNGSIGCFVEAATGQGQYGNDNQTVMLQNLGTGGIELSDMREHHADLKNKPRNSSKWFET